MKNKNPELLHALFGFLIESLHDAQVHTAHLLAFAAKDEEFVMRLAQREDITQHDCAGALASGLVTHNIDVQTQRQQVVVCLLFRKAHREQRGYLYIPFAALCDETAFAKWLCLKNREMTAEFIADLVDDELRARAHGRRLARMTKATIALVIATADRRERKALTVKKGGAS